MFDAQQVYGSVHFGVDPTELGLAWKDPRRRRDWLSDDTPPPFDPIVCYALRFCSVGVDEMLDRTKGYQLKRCRNVAVRFAISGCFQGCIVSSFFSRDAAVASNKCCCCCSCCC